MTTQDEFNEWMIGVFKPDKKDDGIHGAIYTPLPFHDLVGDWNTAILLSQIVYWHRPNKNGQSRLRVERDGHFWVAKQRKDWHEETRLTESQVDKAIKRLMRLGLIETSVHKFYLTTDERRGQTTLHIRLNWDVFLPCLTAVVEEKPMPNLSDVPAKPQRKRQDKMAQRIEQELPNQSQQSTVSGILKMLSPEMTNQQIQSNPRSDDTGTDNPTSPLYSETTLIDHSKRSCSENVCKNDPPYQAVPLSDREDIGVYNYEEEVFNDSNDMNTAFPNVNADYKRTDTPSRVPDARREATGISRRRLSAVRDETGAGGASAGEGYDEVEKLLNEVDLADPLFKSSVTRVDHNAKPATTSGAPCRQSVSNLFSEGWT